MQSSRKSGLMALTLGAMGVVYGDIGTSVLYAIKEIFGLGLVTFNTNNVYGILSILFWTMTIIVSVKYIGLVLRADNNGEGGLIALLALASESVSNKPILHKALTLIGIFGACLFYGDGVITPAISVLSAVEGFALVWHNVEDYVIPATLLILLVLFWVQKRGTAGIGRFFGPIMVLWFIVLAALGAWHITNHPEILLAVNPWYALRFINEAPHIAFLLLGAVVLVATGTEALYADMGHFGKKPIRLAWFSFVMPALTLNYFGQGALLLENPAAAANPFFLMAPEWGLLPLAILATMTTIIASQALITGAFSVTKQVIQLGYLPRLHTLHTSVRELGQIYIPVVNWGLFGAIVLVVMMFKNSESLAIAYGVAVTTDMLITTLITFVVIRYTWHMPLWVCVLPTLFFLFIDLAFWTSNLSKIFEGGWFPIAIALIMLTLMFTWRRGRMLLGESLRQNALPLRGFLDTVFTSPPTRVEGTAVFLTNEPDIVPNALLHNLKHNKILHQRNLFVTVHFHERPWIALDQRTEIEPLGHDCWQIILNFGFKNDPSVPKSLHSLQQRQGLVLNDMEISYFLSRDSVVPTIGKGMALWREKLFAQMHANAGNTADYLDLPSNMVVELGSKIEI